MRTTEHPQEREIKQNIFLYCSAIYAIQPRYMFSPSPCLSTLPRPNCTNSSKFGNDQFSSRSNRAGPSKPHARKNREQTPPLPSSSQLELPKTPYRRTATISESRNPTYSKHRDRFLRTHHNPARQDLEKGEISEEGGEGKWCMMVEIHKWME
ncbi:hypothetical protein M501DRAFT_140940 [Patellaria atrata CBS 101060]|uniref:Uncharacterized protein n=1 Tax=Patellaria atrata CBS 101060 TaxID=1346257 RepID=A0A9P4S824_9PEZI|nr:hypothetical protein M501DRAFT_140940 [Patellaria atrata CBS 101060]